MKKLLVQKIAKAINGITVADINEILGYEVKGKKSKRDAGVHFKLDRQLSDDDKYKLEEGLKAKFPEFITSDKRLIHVEASYKMSTSWPQTTCVNILDYSWVYTTDWEKVRMGWSNV